MQTGSETEAARENVKHNITRKTQHKITMANRLEGEIEYIGRRRADTCWIELNFCKSNKNINNQAWINMEWNVHFHVIENKNQ